MVSEFNEVGGEKTNIQKLIVFLWSSKEQFQIKFSIKIMEHWNNKILMTGIKEGFNKWKIYYVLPISLLNNQKFE